MRDGFVKLCYNKTGASPEKWVRYDIDRCMIWSCTSKEHTVNLVDYCCC